MRISKGQDCWISAAVLMGVMACLSLTSPGAEGWAADAPAIPGANDILARVRATYAGLRSYSDAASVTIESRSGPGEIVTEQHSFTTRYRAPRQFWLDFQKGGAAGERYLIWGEGADFQTWWSATKVHDRYPKGKGNSAFAVSAFPTLDAVTVIPPLLFATAGLQGALTGFAPSEPATVQSVDGRPCYKILGRSGQAYGTGNVAGARTVTIWVDSETFLVRRVFEDTPAGSGQDVISRVTMNFTAVANPDLTDAQFHFAVPGESNQPMAVSAAPGAGIRGSNAATADSSPAALL